MTQVGGEDERLPEEGRDLFLDTEGHCFLCLTEIPSSESDSGSSPVSSSYQAQARYCIQYLLRYLKINVRQTLLVDGEGTFLPDLLGRLDRSRLKISLCGGCASVTEKFSELYKLLEELQMQIMFWLGEIGGKLAMAEEDGIREKLGRLGKEKNAISKGLLGWRAIQTVEALRRETMKKCSQKLKTEQPRVRLKRLVLEEKTLPLPFSSDEGNCHSDDDIRAEVGLNQTCQVSDDEGGSLSDGENDRSQEDGLPPEAPEDPTESTFLDDDDDKLSDLEEFLGEDSDEDVEALQIPADQYLSFLETKFSEEPDLQIRQNQRDIPENFPRPPPPKPSTSIRKSTRIQGEACKPGPKLSKTAQPLAGPSRSLRPRPEKIPPIPKNGTIHRSPEKTCLEKSVTNPKITTGSKRSRPGPGRKRRTSESGETFTPIQGKPGKSNCRKDPESGQWICGDCGRHFSLRQAAQNHYRSQHLKIRYRCDHPQCGKEFGSYNGYKNHRLSIHKGAKFTCTECGLSFIRSTSLRMHKRFGCGVKISRKKRPSAPSRKAQEEKTPSPTPVSVKVEEVEFDCYICRVKTADLSTHLYTVHFDSFWGNADGN